MYAGLRKHPFLRLAVALILGIFLGRLWPAIPPSFLYSFAVGTMLLYISFTSFAWKSMVVGMSFLLILTILFIGWALHNKTLPRHQANHFSHTSVEGSCELLLLVDELMQHQLHAEVLQVNNHGTRGRVLLFHASDSIWAHLSPGDLIHVQAHFRELNAPANPADIDYRPYYATHHIYHSIYADDYQLIESEYGRQLKATIFYWHKYFSNVLKQNISKPEAQALTQALLLGDRSDLTEEVVAAFADTGAIHVLAVSGLHLGLFYLLFRFMLSFLRSGSAGTRVLRSVLIIGSLWAFALLVGGRPSVLRAALMFSVFECSQVLLRRNYALNSWALAAFVLLIFEPQQLFSIGFQLSFTAVLGILLLQPHIERMWIIEHKWGHTVWQLVSLSFAAQLFTFPLVVYYFNQFPLLFWLSGILAVYLAYGILIVGISLMLFHWLPILAFLMGWMLTLLTEWMYFWIQSLQAIPGMVIGEIWFEGWQLLLLTVLVALLGAIILNRDRRLIFYWFLCLFIFEVSAAGLRWSRWSNSEFVVYALRDGSYADVFLGNKVYAFEPKAGKKSDVPEPAKRYRFFKHTSSQLWSEGLGESQYLGFFTFPGVTGYVYDGTQSLCVEKIVDVDLIWLLDKPEFCSAEFGAAKAERPTVLVDRAIPFYEARSVQELWQNHGYLVHNLHTDGAYQYELK